MRSCAAKRHRWPSPGSSQRATHGRRGSAAKLEAADGGNGWTIGGSQVYGDHDLQNQADTLTGMVGGITDVDMADAVTRLEAAKLAVQASAQVFASLQNSSLLNYLK